MVRFFFVALLVAFAIPSSAFALVGFAQESVWVSRTPVYEGETVLIYAAITNGDENEKLQGTAHFRDNGELVGSIAVSLTPGEARIISSPWKPAAGEHSLAVEIASSTLPLTTRTETKKITVLKDKPAPQDTQSNLISPAAAGFTDSTKIVEAIDGISPTVAGIMSPAFEKADSWRESGADFMEAQTIKTQATIETTRARKEVLKSDDSAEAKKESRILAAKQILYTVLIYLYEALHALVAKALLFYPFIFALIIFMLWKFYRRMTRPKYSY